MALGKDLAWINNRIAAHPQMTVMYGRAAPTPPTAETVETRGDMAEPAINTVLSLNIMKQDQSLLRYGLERAGIKAATIEKLRIFEDFSDNTGRFLVSTLDLTHRMQVYQNAALFEEAEFIRTNYLQNETLPHELRLEWMKRFVEISELIGKTFDRTLVGTETIARMLKGAKPDGDPKKPKPAFTKQFAPKNVGPKVGPA